MTHDLLQSDVEVAIRLMAEGRADDQIITALARRRLDPAKAVRLVDDLRNGRKVVAQPALPQEFALRRSRSRSAARESVAPPPTRSPKPEPRPELPSPSGASKRKKPAVMWIVAAILLFLAIVVVGSALFQRYSLGSRHLEEQEPRTAAARGKSAPKPEMPRVETATRHLSPAPLGLELQPDGLRIDGKLLTRDNLLPAVVSLLGPPTLTNQVSQTKTLVYAYDHLGLLIYSHPAGGTNSLVLDCEGIGGANGTTSPFAGTLRVEADVIGPNTDSQTLAAIKQLALAAPKAGGTIWHGSYRNVDVVFAYLKSPRRPSLIELDLK